MPKKCHPHRPIIIFRPIRMTISPKTLSDSSLHLIASIQGVTFNEPGNGMQNLEMTVILAWVWRVTPVLVGAGGGYLFYRLVGCKSGVCPITRSPWLSTIYGAILGAMFIVR
jgi:Family of unknown function (DUF6132)